MIVLLIVLIVAFIGVGLALGFPWEKIKAADAAKNYVIQTYGFTPTDVQIKFMFDVEGSATIKTKELPFAFDVSINRKNVNPDNDKYLSAAVEYYLNQAIKEEMEPLLGNSRKVIACLGINLTRKSPKGITIEEINHNRKAVIEKLKDNYYCLVVSENKEGKNQIIDEQDYQIFKILSEKFQPTYISFKNSKKEKVEWKSVRSENFKIINNVDDLIIYAE